MDAPADRPSWWVGLDRAEFQREIAARVETWRKQKRPFLDHVGATLLMRDAWEPRHRPRDVRLERER